MDIFTKMTSGTITDFDVFKAKRKTEPVKPQEEKVPVPKPQNQAEPPKVETVEPVAVVPEDKAEVKSEESRNAGEKVIQFRKPETRNEEASVKLEAELETAKSNLLPVFPIVRYLKNKCMADTAFAETVLDERKTLQKCFDHVTSEVKKALNSQNGWLDDNEVYAYAETYYLTDEAIFEQMAAEKAAEEKKRREAVAKKRKEQEEKRKKAAKESKKKKTQKELVEQAVKEDEVLPVPDTKPVENEEIAPVMQEQLCLEL